MEPALNLLNMNLQMIREKKLERRRQRMKAAEPAQHDQEPEMMTVSPAASGKDQKQEAFEIVATKQHGGHEAEVNHVRRQRRRRRRPKQSSVADVENSEKYENGWLGSESEHVAGASSHADVVASRSEPPTLPSRESPLLTPHPAVRGSSVSTPFSNKGLMVQPAVLHKLNSDFDVEPALYCPPQQSKCLH